MAALAVDHLVVARIPPIPPILVSAAGRPPFPIAAATHAPPTASITLRPIMVAKSPTVLAEAWLVSTILTAA